MTKPQVTIKGKSQAGSAIRLQNGANGAIATVTAGKEGLWQTAMAVANGTNLIPVTAVNRPATRKTGELRVVKGSAS